MSGQPKLALSKSLLNKIKMDFDEHDLELVVSELESVTLEHVMAGSQVNLDNTWVAILQLSKGNLSELGRLVDAAKLDFRDVIYWAALENENSNT
jgi:hypothetical protein